MNKRIILRLCHGFVLLNLCVLYPAAASTPPVAYLQANLKQTDKIWPGQRLRYNITLFTRGTFTGVPHFELPVDSGILMINDDSHPLLGNTEVDHISYLSKQYTITVLPLRAGVMRLPVFKVSFAYRDDQQKTATIRLSTLPQTFRVWPVPGADPALALVTSTHFTVTDRWQLQTEAIKAGDARTRSITLTAEDVPGMLLPAIELSGMKGVSIYPATPQLNTHTRRGTYIGKRQQQYSYVFEKPGHYSLPGITIQWWNPQTRELTKQRIKGGVFTVAANPLWQAKKLLSGTTGMVMQMQQHWKVISIAGLLLLVILPWFIFWLRKRSKTASHTDEKHMFKHFQQACLSNNPLLAVKTLTDWLTVSGLGGKNATLVSFSKHSADPELSRQITQLEKHLYCRNKTGQRHTWHGETLYRSVAEVRRHYRRKKRSTLFSSSGKQLPALNPSIVHH